MLCHMTSRRDNSPHRSPSKLRILALEAELATERSARATLFREHADLQAKNVALQEKVAELQAGHAELLVKHEALQAKHDLLVAEHDRLNAFLKLYASEHHSEKRIFSPDARQLKLLFEQSPELAAAREAALAEAAKLVEQHKARSATRPQRGKRQSDKGLPAGLRRVIEMVEASPEQLVCELHGERKLMGYDKVETLVHKRPELYVLERQYPKHVCPGCPTCGVATPPRPTGLIGGDRIDTSVGATVVVGKWWYHMPLYRMQDYFAALSWQASRSTLNNLVKAIDFVLQPLYDLQKRLVQGDCIVSFDDTTCRMLVSALNPDDSDEPLRDKLTKMQRRNAKSIVANMWAYSGQSVLDQSPRRPTAAGGLLGSRASQVGPVQNQSDAVPRTAGVDQRPLRRRDARRGDDARAARRPTTEGVADHPRRNPRPLARPRLRRPVEVGLQDGRGLHQ